MITGQVMGGAGILPFGGRGSGFSSRIGGRDVSEREAELLSDGKRASHGYGGSRRAALRPELPSWLASIRRAKAAAWEALPPDEKQRALETLKRWRAQKGHHRREREQIKRERMKRILDLYLDGHSVDEIGAELGLTGRRSDSSRAKWASS